jgi:Collagen triple helix repeat (20 copies)
MYRCLGILLLVVVSTLSFAVVSVPVTINTASIDYATQTITLRGQGFCAAGKLPLVYFRTTQLTLVTTVCSNTLVVANLPVQARASYSVTVTNGSDGSGAFDVAYGMAERGPAGPKGAQGPIGLTGAMGVGGATGPQGPAGATGATGPQGPIGPTGTTGAQGSTGTNGGGLNFRNAFDPTATYALNDVVSYNGSTYVAILVNGPNTQTPDQNPGVWSIMAQQGAIGPQGPQGLIGAMGPQGTTGATGSQGPVGATGPAGAAGASPFSASGINTYLSQGFLGLGGVTSPAAPLHVAAPSFPCNSQSPSDFNIVALFDNCGGAHSGNTNVYNNLPAGGGDNNYYLSVGGVIQGGLRYNNGGGYLALTEGNGVVPDGAEPFVLKSGNVGIGTTSPAASLDVNGNIAIAGTPVISSTGQWVGNPTGLIGPMGPQGLTGATGPQGPTGAGPEGPAGPTGPQGPAGPTGPASVTFAARYPSGQSWVTLASGCCLNPGTTVATLNLGAGSYLILATVQVTNLSGATPVEVDCALYDSDGVINTRNAFADVDLEADGPIVGSWGATLPVNTAATFPGDVTVTLSCSYGGAGSATVEAGAVTLSAIQANVTVQ